MRQKCVLFLSVMNPQFSGSEETILVWRTSIPGGANKILVSNQSKQWEIRTWKFRVSVAVARQMSFYRLSIDNLVVCWVFDWLPPMSQYLTEHYCDTNLWITTGSISKPFVDKSAAIAKGRETFIIDRCKRYVLYIHEVCAQKKADIYTMKSKR